MKEFINIKVLKMNKMVFLGLGLLLVFGFMGCTLPNQQNTTNNTTNTFLSQEKVNEITSVLNDYFLLQGLNANLTLLNQKDMGSFYLLNYSINGKPMPLAVSKDGEYIFTSAMKISDLKKQIELIKNQTKEEKKEQKMEKTSKPNVELFVMSYCPYGTQAEKALIPAYDLLKDKANISIKFVSYAMHGKKEVDENLRQYCIQKNFGIDKEIEYLKCFLVNGTYDECLNYANINKTMLNQCMNETDEEYRITEMYNNKSTWLSGYYPQFNIYKDLNILYGVQGSPTWVINGKQIDIPRNAESVKEAICEAFLNPPFECNQTLDQRTTSVGIGPFYGGTSQEGHCG